MRVKFGGCWVGIVTLEGHGKKWILFAPIPFLVFTWELVADGGVQ